MIYPWRSATLMIKHYGDTTDIAAAARADEFEAKRRCTRR